MDDFIASFLWAAFFPIFFSLPNTKFTIAWNFIGKKINKLLLKVSVLGPANTTFSLNLFQHDPLTADSQCNILSQHQQQP